jgi:hypothetical protein
LHLGWIKQQLDDGEYLKWCYGAFIENGRIIDGNLVLFILGVKNHILFTINIGKW